MRTSLRITALGALAMVAGCYGGASRTTPLAPANQGFAQFHAAARGDASGIAPQVLRGLHFGRAALPHATNARPPGVHAAKNLYITDFGTGATAVLQNGTWAMVRSIKSGLNGPDGNFMDQQGNLYVANYSGINVQEYARNGSTPKFTYSGGLIDPTSVTVDTNGNVYAGDSNFGAAGFVNEYAQGVNTVTATCSVTGPVEGLAVDSAGDVFVVYVSNGVGQFAEFVGGLSGCSATILGASVTYPGGMIVDAQNNLIACDQLGKTVDVIAPPYSAVTGTIGTGYGDPFHVALSSDNKLLFVADVANKNVQILDYPSGSNVTTLGAANGLVDPGAVADDPEAVY